MGAGGRGMAECVSCGREIPQGRLFCDQCYARMKGRMGPRRKGEVPPEAGAAASPHYRSSASAPGGEAAPDNISVLGEGRASGSAGARAVLTPPAQKKVVSMRPLAEKGAGEKGRAAKKFTITITFSEKTYERISRMKRRLKGEGRKKGKEKPSGTAVTPMPREGRKRGKRGPYGRPALRAVDGTGVPGGGGRKGPAGMLLHRARPWDWGDRFAVATATCGAAAVAVFSFLAWVRVRWVSQGGGALQEVGVRGVDLGGPVYAAMALAVLAWCFMAAALILGGERLKVDFGVVLLLAGLVIIPLVFVALSGNSGVYNAAMKAAWRKNLAIPAEAAGYERHAVWPSYLMVLGGLAVSFAGLVRLSERGPKAADRGAAGGEGGS